MLGWGFTTIFSTAHAYGDLEDFTDLRRAAQGGESTMARYFGVGRGITVEGGHASQPPLASFLPKTPEEAREQVRQLKTAGVDAVKFIFEDLRWHGRDVPVMRRDVMQAIKSVEKARHPGIHIFIATSDLHLQRKLMMSRQEVIDAACWADASEAVRRCFDMRSERSIASAAAGLEAVLDLRSVDRKPNDRALRFLAADIRAGLADLTGLLRRSTPAPCPWG